MLSLISFTGAHATAIKEVSGEEGVLLMCMMDDQSTEDNVNAVCEVLHLMSAHSSRVFSNVCPLNASMHQAD